MDPRYAPEGIGTVDLADQISDFLGNPWPAGRTARFQPPERLEAVPVPARLALSVVAGRSGKRLSSSSLRPLCAGIGRGPRLLAMEVTEAAQAGQEFPGKSET